MSHDEIKRNISPFDSYAWLRRTLARKKREILRNKKVDSKGWMSRHDAELKSFKLI